MPSTLAAIGTLLLTGWIGLMLGGRRIGWAAAAVLLSCLGFFVFLRSAAPDMLLTFWITTALACFVRRATGGSPLFGWCYFIAIGLGLIIGGFMAAFVPLCAAVGWNLGCRHVGKTQVQMPWASGFVLIVVTMLAWIVATGFMLGSAPARSFSDHCLALLVDRAPIRGKAPLTVLVVLTVGTLPWLPVALGSILNWLALRKSDWRLSPTGWLLLGWIVSAFVVRTILAPWTFAEMLPAFPAFALWIAARGKWHDADRSMPLAGLAGVWAAWWYRVSLLCALMLMVSPAIALSAAALTLPNFQQLGLSSWFGPVAGPLALACCVAIYAWTMRGSAAAEDRWGRFEDAAVTVLTLLGVVLWLLLGAQIVLWHRLLVTG